MLHLNLVELPKCGTEKCDGNLLPIEDTSREGDTVYLKGWFCPTCSTSWLFNSGRVYIFSITVQAKL
jgi:hypothetical protein